MQNRGVIPNGSSSAPTARLEPDVARPRALLSAWLLHCADPLGSNLDPPSAQLPAHQLKKLFRKANAHKVLPSVLRHYPMPEGDIALTQIREEAEEWVVGAAALSAMLKHHASTITAAAKALPVALVKGPAFSPLYPPGLRPFGDIDLLAAPSALPRLASILAQHGFTRVDEDPTRLEDAWIHRGNGLVMIEVHTNLVHSSRMRAAFSLTYDHLAGHFERPAARLSIAVMHGSMHFFAWLRHVVDLVQAARAVTTAEEESLFETLTDRTGTRMAAIVGLNLAYRLFAEQRCLKIAQALGAPCDYRFAPTLIDGAVLTAPIDNWLLYNTWRRFIYSELLRSGTLIAARRNGARALDAPASPAVANTPSPMPSIARGTRVLAFTSSRHRPVMLRHCIMQLRRQSYPVDHVIYVNSPEKQTGSETSLYYGTLLDDACRNGQGLTRIAYGPSSTHHQNYFSAIQLAQIDDYDLFLKVDDDDIYLKDYVLDVVRDFEKHRWDYSGTLSQGHLNGYRWKPKEVLMGLGLGKIDFDLGVPDVMPATLAVSRRAIEQLLTLKDDGSFEDSQWRRHLARIPGIVMWVRDDQNFIYNIHGANASTGSWLE